MRRILGAIDAFTETVGKIGCWFAVGMIALMSYEVIMRHVFDSPSMWAPETTIMMAVSLYVLGFAYAERHRAHIRVDVIYNYLSPRGKAFVDVFGSLLFFFPLIALTTITAISWAQWSWETNELMPLTGWLPPAAPLRTMVAIGFCILTLQGASHFFRDLYFLIRNKPL